jgi:transglutaminase-like putative cysteine protease
MEAARLFYDVVNRHMRYSKEGTGWGRGDAVWACDSKFGNCTDFHSLFISLARSHKIPAKFEMGFSLPVARGAGKIAGYHCWAWFLPSGKGWVPVDISEANRNPEKLAYFFGSLTEDRIALSVGRDIVLVPPQKGPPLNFFIYPHVEVDGQPLPAQKVESVFSFQDISSGR